MRALPVVALLAAAVLTACQDDEPKTYSAPTTAQQDAATALRYAPRVWLATEEAFPPMSADAYIRQSALRYQHEHCRDREPVAEHPDPGLLGTPSYRHRRDGEPDVVPGVHTSPVTACASHSGAEISPDAEGNGFYLDAPETVGPDDEPPVYWEHHRSDDGRHAYVYWFFYGRNELKPLGTPVGNRHEGDWERVAVQLDGDQPVAVTFFGHGGDPCSMPWAEVDPVDDHPVVYAALGSHASYPSKGWHVTPPTFDYTSQGVQWKTEEHARPVAEEPWYGYRGRWGSPSEVPGFGGPSGPYPGRFLADVFTERRCDGAQGMPREFSGTWETREPVWQSPATTPHHLRVILNGEANAVAYRSSWAGRAPALDCSGVWRLNAASADTLDLRETITQKRAGDCADQGAVALRRDGDTLAMTYVSGGTRASATLYRASAPGSTTSGPPPQDTAPAPSGVRRYEDFLHAVGREDLATVCEIAGPAAEQAEEKGFGTCVETFPVTFAMLSPAQKAALRQATIDESQVSAPSPGRLEIPTSAIRAPVTFTADVLGDAVLELRGGQWYVVD